VKDIFFITVEDARYGFHLAGVNQIVIAAEELEETLQRITRDHKTGMVVIDERLIDGVSEERLRETESRWPGIIIVLPAPEQAEAEDEDYALRLIRRAIGYHVRLNR
jgi:V/A-type H+-transporting ATPase subunit F